MPLIQEYVFANTRILYPAAVMETTALACRWAGLAGAALGKKPILFDGVRTIPVASYVG